MAENIAEFELTTPLARRELVIDDHWQVTARTGGNEEVLRLPSLTALTLTVLAESMDVPLGYSEILDRAFKRGGLAIEQGALMTYEILPGKLTSAGIRNAIARLNRISNYQVSSNLLVYVGKQTNIMLCGDTSDPESAVSLFARGIKLEDNKYAARNRVSNLLRYKRAIEENKLNNEAEKSTESTDESVGLGNEKKLTDDAVGAVASAEHETIEPEVSSAPPDPLPDAGGQTKEVGIVETKGSTLHELMISRFTIDELTVAGREYAKKASNNCLQLIKKDTPAYSWLFKKQVPKATFMLMDVLRTYAERERSIDEVCEYLEDYINASKDEVRKMVTDAVGYVVTNFMLKDPGHPLNKYISISTSRMTLTWSRR